MPTSLRPLDRLRRPDVAVSQVPGQAEAPTPTATTVAEVEPLTVYVPIQERIRDLADKQHITILLTEHDMEVVFSIAKRIVVVHQGSIIADGAPEAVLLAEQNMRFTTRLAHRGYVIDKGRIHYQGTMEELRRDEQIIGKFLAV